MTESIYELYGEIWGKLDEDVGRTLNVSLNPRPSAMLYDYLNEFGITEEQTILDIGSRHATHAIEIVTRFGCRVEAVDPIALHSEQAKEKVVTAGLADQITVTTAGIEKIPLADGIIDHVWCRDMLNHVDLARGLAECFRVLKGGGRMLVYQTFATAFMEPQEAVRIYAAMAIVGQNMSQEYFESCVAVTGFGVVKQESIGSEWRENNVENGDHSLLQDLLFMARLQRIKADFVATYGTACYAATYADCAWGVYQMLGKLNPTVYILQKPN
jgi:ubiquinone/menaquinone biosynthesis C-methylase UbiE